MKKRQKVGLIFCTNGSCNGHRGGGYNKDEVPHLRGRYPDNKESEGIIMRKKSTRLLSAALAACMMVSALPVGAFAAAPAAASTESAVSTQAEEDAVAIDATNFPDGAFRQYVADNFDKDKDGALNQTERNAVKEIEISNSGCTSLQGLKYFSKLTDLFCSDNNLTELDVSENPELVRLICYNNSLTSLNLNKNTKLRSLNCNNNKLTVLDLRENKSLSWLRCKNNCLTSLDLRNNPKIGDLQVGSQRYQILANDDRTYDLHQLPGKFELDGVTTGSWKGGTVDPATWILKANSTTVTYNYEVADDGFNFPVTLDVHWHNYQWEHDGTKHWKVCTTANCPGLTADQEAEGPHTFASAKDAACADGCGYTRPLYTVTVKNATAILGGEELNAPVAAGTKVTLTADTTPEGKTFHGWKLYKVAADGTVTEITDEAELAKLLNGEGRIVTLTVPAYNVKAVPDYADILYDVNPVKCTVTLNNVEVPAAAKGDVITATPNEQGPGKKFTGWTVTKTVNGKEVDITDELRDVSQNGLTIAELTMPGANVTIEARFDDDSGPDLDQPVVTDDGSGDIVAGVVIGGIAVVGAYEVGTGLYRITQMDDVAMPTNRIALAKLLWERAGKPEPESTALYSDISAEDTDAQKAARWAVEQGLLNDAEDGKFHPAFPVSKLRVCLTWEKAKQKGLFDKTEA